MIIILEQLLRTVILFVLFFFLTLISVSDIKVQKIPDLYIVIIMLLGIILNYKFITFSMADCLKGSLSIGLFMLLCALVWDKSFGGGDIKLMMAAAFIIGFKGVWRAFSSGVIMAFPYALYVIKNKRNKRSFPVGPYLCMGIYLQIIWIVYKG